MTRLGRHDGRTLTVDLRSKQIVTWDDLWETLAGPCGLPTWFGRNLDAWWDTVETGAISEVLDNYEFVVVRVRATGFFAAGNPDGDAFRDVTDQSTSARVELDAA